MHPSPLRPGLLSAKGMPLAEQAGRPSQVVPSVVLFTTVGLRSATFCIEFLEANPTGLALAMDTIESEVLWSRIPAHLRSRLQYHRAESTDWLDKVILEIGSGRGPP